MTSFAPPIERVEAQWVQAEFALIGAALFDAAACMDALERVKPEHLYDPVCQRVWATIVERSAKGRIPDQLSIFNALSEDAGLDELGGMGFLSTLLDRASLYGLENRIEEVLDGAAKRALIRLGDETRAAASDPVGATSEAILARLEESAAAIAREGSAAPQAVAIGDGLLNDMEDAWAGKFAGASVGLDTLDRVTGGIRQSDVWFVGGRTSMGKSVLGLCLARGIAEQGRGVMMFSLEMPTREVRARLVADVAWCEDQRWHAPYNVRYGDILKGKLPRDERDAAMLRATSRRAAERTATLPITVNDAGGLTIQDIRTQALRQMRMWEKEGVERGAILIDHIGLVKPHAPRQGDSKAAETADVVNELKSLAKQVRAPVIALCQVNRNTESRNDKRPTLADLNWSGAIEQIADLICLLYRPAYYLERSADAEDQIEALSQQHDLELLIHKNRSGPICNLKTFVDVACNAVRDLPDEHRRHV